MESTNATFVYDGSKPISSTYDALTCGQSAYDSLGRIRVIDDLPQRTNLTYGAESVADTPDIIDRADGNES